MKDLVKTDLDSDARDDMRQEESLWVGLCFREE